MDNSLKAMISLFNITRRRIAGSGELKDFGDAMRDDKSARQFVQNYSIPVFSEKTVGRFNPIIVSKRQ